MESMKGRGREQGPLEQGDVGDSGWMALPWPAEARNVLRCRTRLNS